TGDVQARFGDSITQAMAVDPSSGKIYVSSGKGVEIFDPVKHSFAHFSNTRVDSLAFAPDGTLSGTTWPERRDVIKFEAQGHAQRMVKLDTDADSIAFGQEDTKLAGILFVSSNDGQLIAVDTATLDHVVIALNGTRGETLVTTPDGRLLIAQSHQIDVVNPITLPHVAFVNPPDGAVVPLPMIEIKVAF